MKIQETPSTTSEMVKHFANIETANQRRPIELATADQPLFFPKSPESPRVPHNRMPVIFLPAYPAGTMGTSATNSTASQRSFKPHATNHYNNGLRSQPIVAAVRT